jgi:hypothetical protein
MERGMAARPPVSQSITLPLRCFRPSNHQLLTAYLSCKHTHTEPAKAFLFGLVCSVGNLVSPPLIRNQGNGNEMPTKKKSSRRKYGKAAGKRVASAMRRKKRGTLRSGKGGRGGKVKSRKQAIAIGLSEARKKGAKVPRKSKS